MDKGKRKYVTPTQAKRLHGKDAKLVGLVRDADLKDESKEVVNFDAKKIGKKAIFRPILTSPFNTRWPAVRPVLQDVVLHSLLQLLQTEEAQRHFKRDSIDTPRTSSGKTKEKNKRRRTRLASDVLRQQGVLSDLATEINLRKLPKSDEKTKVQEKPFLCGLNSVTRQLESLIREELDGKPAEDAGEGSTTASSVKHKPSIIFVCQADVDPAALVSHFPLLVATYNSVLKQESYLIGLPAGAEGKLSEATSLRRCSVLSIDAALLEEDSNDGRSLKEMFAKIRDFGTKGMRLDWLDSAVSSLRSQEGPRVRLIEPRVKHMRSSALLDMNAVKATKKAARKRKSLEKKARSGK